MILVKKLATFFGLNNAQVLVSNQNILLLIVLLV